MLLLFGFVGATVVSLTAASDHASRRPAARHPAPGSSTSPAPAARDVPPAADAAAADGLPPLVRERAWNSIVLHHSATSAGDVASIDAVHRQQKDIDGRPWLGIGYHFVVGNGRKMADGEIQPTFRWFKQLPGAHAGQRDYNDHGIGICLIGNFDEMPPTEKQLVAVSALVKRLADRHAIPRARIVRHQDVQATACPGRLFPWEAVVAHLPGFPRGM